jgi:1,4-alpha-glucan branching enzyme
MMGHEGKKLLFMGQEFGQEHEWNEAAELEWWRLEEGKDDNYLNIGMKYYVQRLLEIYRTHKCLYEIDDDWAGFEWINADDADRSIYSFFRKCPSQKKSLLFVLNMTPVKREGYRVGVPVRKQYKLLLNSTELVFGGDGETSVPEVLKAHKGECDGRDQYIEFDLPAYGACVFEFSL